ncbi:hypothetical protein ACM55F_10045 [Flavobacterium sp. XS2P12]|uniref:hypothetical protein n=1 Tax=Flavobacterium melibiosi TaxID=3398734 RepID=UPI003A861D9C
MKNEEKILLEKDVILPSKKTIEVYNLGSEIVPRYIVTEHTVRRELATHKICTNCENPYIKNGYCKPCYKKNNNESYYNKPFLEWNGETPLVIHDSNEYFFDVESVEQYMEENEIDENDLQLMICSPNYCRQIEEDYFSDEMPENFETLSDFDKILVQKLKEINEYIATLKPMSWSEGKFRTEFKLTEPT